MPVSYKKASKKRKASLTILFTTINSDNENSNSSQNAAFYMQLVVDNLLLALEKETNLSVSTKI